MSRTRAADDFATIRARMEELRRERASADDGDRAAEEPARGGDSYAERRRRARMLGLPPPWAPTIFVKKMRP